MSLEADILSVSPSSEQLMKGCRSKQPLNSIRWLIYVFNSVVNTKLPISQKLLFFPFIVQNEKAKLPLITNPKL